MEWVWEWWQASATEPKMRWSCQKEGTSVTALLGEGTSGRDTPQTELLSGSKPKRSPVCNVEVLVRSFCERSFESSKSERERHDRPTWRQPCGRGAARRARETAGGGRGGGPRRALAVAGRTAIGEGLCGSRNKLIKSTASELWPTWCRWTRRRSHQPAGCSCASRRGTGTRSRRGGRPW